MKRLILLTAGVAVLLVAWSSPGVSSSSDWNAVNQEALPYFQSYLRFDTSNPPDNSAPAIAYLKSILDQEGIETATFQSKLGAVSLVARLPGPPDKKPFLLLSHVDVVPVVAQDCSQKPL